MTHSESTLAQRNRCHVRVSRAIKLGKLVRPSECGQCGRTPKRVRAHHDDYTKPLEVRWLCDSCHGTEHAALHAPKVRHSGASDRRLVGF